MITASRFRALCLALEDAAEAPHMDRVAFRTPQRIFATLAPDKKSANLMFTAEHQELFCSAVPEAFAPVAGGWGRMGATTVLFDVVDEKTMKDALHAAHARAMEKKSKARKKTKSGK